jgi:nucleoside-diphosphate-sugar epimerase
MDTTYVDNAADAHLKAFAALGPGSACAGKAYFISNGEPQPVREIINGLLVAAGEPRVEASVPFAVAYAAGALCEVLWHTLPLKGEPPMTRFVAEQLATPHWYDLTAAKRDFGYVPQVRVAEGLDRLARWWRDAHRSP